MLGAIDVERGAKVSGSRFYYLTGAGADLEFALVNMAMDQARDAGFTTMIPPTLVKPRAMEGTGFLGQAADDVYRIEGQDTYLVGTSEVPLAAYHSDEILDAESLPLRYAAFSPCFRKEAGSHGKDTRGIIRVHWFDKVEMFTYTTVEESFAEHQRLLGWEKEWLDKLELAYRVIDTAAGDLGLSAQRKFDCEAWVPTQGRYRELTSTSNCTDFQARRLDIRGRFGRAGRHQAARDAQRHPGRDPAHHRGDPRDPPAGRRLGAGARGAAALPPGPRRARAGVRCLTGARAWSRSTSTAPCCSWVDGAGTTHEEIRPAVYDAVHRAVADGAHIVLASGRSPARHDPDRRPARPARRRGRPALGGRLQRRGDLPLPAARGRPRGDLRRRGPRWPRCWSTTREALVAVEERGVGYRVNRHFPTGELSGDMIVTEIDELVAGPVSRVIIRDPEATADDFVGLAARLGLHGTDYVVGWTAWMDLAPVGVSKASGLEHVAAHARRRPPPTRWPSATAATTSRCCAGPAAAWRWARRCPRSTRPRTRPRSPWTRTAPPSSCRSGSPSSDRRRGRGDVRLHRRRCGAGPTSAATAPTPGTS